MLERLEQELQSIQQEQQQVSNQRSQLQQGLQNAEIRLIQLQGAQERIAKLIEEVKADAAKDSSGQDRTVETSEVRDDQNVPANV